MQMFAQFHADYNVIKTLQYSIVWGYCWECTDVLPLLDIINEQICAEGFVVNNVSVIGQ